MKRNQHHLHDADSSESLKCAPEAWEKKIRRYLGSMNLKEGIESLFDKKGPPLTQFVTLFSLNSKAFYELSFNSLKNILWPQFTRALAINVCSCVVLSVILVIFCNSAQKSLRFKTLAFYLNYSLGILCGLQ